MPTSHPGPPLEVRKLRPGKLQAGRLCQLAGRAEPSDPEDCRSPHQNSKASSCIVLRGCLEPFAGSLKHCGATMRRGAGTLTRRMLAMVSALPATPVWALTWWIRTRCSCPACCSKSLARRTTPVACWALVRPLNVPRQQLPTQRHAAWGAMSPCEDEDVREGLLIVSVSPRTRLIQRTLRDILAKHAKRAVAQTEGVVKRRSRGATLLRDARQ